MRNAAISFALLAFAVGSAAAAGCSSPDPGVVLSQPVHLEGVGGGGSAVTGNSSGTGTTSSSGVATTSSSGTTTTTTEDAGGTTTTGGTDAGEDGSATAAFLGETTAWNAAGQPTTTAYTYHANVGQPQQTPNLDCMQTCHAAGGAGGAFLIAGWVATAAGGTTGAAGVEVRIDSTAGVGGSTYTDANGYFWLLPPAAGAPTGSFNGGARNGTTSDLMPATQTNYDCNNSNCHGTTVIHVP